MIENVTGKSPSLADLTKFLGDSPRSVRELVYKIEAKKKCVYDGRTVRSVQP